jgi:hypothetical protein
MKKGYGGALICVEARATKWLFLDFIHQALAGKEK